MMTMIKAKIREYGGVRKLHTIISQETIKPSSPTPHHLKTYNFSLLDHFAPNLHMPKVFFYKNYNDGNTKNLKQSLSKCLTQYYPFAGRFPSPSASYIDCNDEGIEFSEALIDSKIDDFVFNKNQDETMDQLIPNGFGCIGGTTSPNNLLEVQLNHFTCGGVAIAVSISHKVADGFTAASFINHWASVASCQSPVNPKFILSPTSDHIIKIPEVMNKGTDKRNYVARKFIFPNSKLNELKKKVISMGTTPMNPSRVELLTSLIFKCSMGATITKSGCFKPSNLVHCVNMRNKLTNICPNTAAGNIFTLMNAKIASKGKIMLAEVIYELKKGKLELDGLQSLQEVEKHYLSTLSMLEGDESRTFVSSSLCRFPFYNVDFGWGKPIKVSTRYPDVDDNGVLLLDAPSGDGIEALVHLEKEEMSIFEMDEELLAHVEDE
ncbi:transferase, Chloramphenicol acetyltransferase-like domain protein [Artemisia annua]|uniref:Transferase, Chloramphenicol acetyltransferase-like domain protein n=1 Tax=Artemisia annua TaxID=35608 RepID=A0A2U1LIY7_ARTAN|nr:transferase, Chloramphenicol acetyltransferase-like domain protein [Artemisia annua]